MDDNRPAEQEIKSLEVGDTKKPTSTLHDPEPLTPVQWLEGLEKKKIEETKLEMKEKEQEVEELRELVWELQQKLEVVERSANRKSSTPMLDRWAGEDASGEESEEYPLEHRKARQFLEPTRSRPFAPILNKPSTYGGPSGDLSKTSAWLYSVQKYVKIVTPRYPMGDIVDQISGLLTDSALSWLEDTELTMKREFFDVHELLEEIRKWAIPAYYEQELMDEMDLLKQGDLSVQAYSNKLTHLVREIGGINTKRKIHKFFAGLDPRIRRHSDNINIKTYAEAVAAAVNSTRQANLDGTLTLSKRSHPHSVQVAVISEEITFAQYKDKLEAKLYLHRHEDLHFRANGGCYGCRKYQAGHDRAECPIDPKRKSSSRFVPVKSVKRSTSTRYPTSLTPAPIRQRSEDNSSTVSNKLVERPIDMVAPLVYNPLFLLTINDRTVLALIDTGCGSMLVSQAFASSLDVIQYPIEPIHFGFANGSSGQADTKITVLVSKGRYKRLMDFVVAPISAPMIIGTPWLASINITGWDLTQGILSFSNPATALCHNWYSKGYSGARRSQSKLLRRQESSSKVAVVASHEGGEKSEKPTEHELIGTATRQADGVGQESVDTVRKDTGIVTLTGIASQSLNVGRCELAVEGVLFDESDKERTDARIATLTGIESKSLNVERCELEVEGVLFDESNRERTDAGIATLTGIESNFVVVGEELTVRSGLEGEWQLGVTAAVQADSDDEDAGDLDSELVPLSYIFEVRKTPALEPLLPASFIKQLLSNFASTFEKPTSLPPSRPEDHKIQLTSLEVPKSTGVPYIAPAGLEVLKEKLDEGLDADWFTRSMSPYASPVLLIKKPDESYRMCIDFRKLNSITKKDATPMPSITEMRDQLQGATMFTKFDLRDGFYNILMHPSDREKTAFKTRYGLFECNVMPFGLTNAPGTFCRMMSRVFHDFTDVCVITYVDDILIYSKNATDHKRHITMVLERLKLHSLYLKPSKCVFGASKVEFCGVEVSSAGITLPQNRLQPIFNMGHPRNLKEVQTFLGMAGYFRDFIDDFAGISGCLSDLTKKDVEWRWTEREQNAVVVMLHQISSTPSLRFFDPTLDTIVYTDASDYGIGGWLGQMYADGVHPVGFWSRKLTGAELSYPVHERELLALVCMLKKYRPYLLCDNFVAKVDHKALTHLQQQPELSPRQCRWVGKLQEYSFDIEYLPGHLNALADILSRDPQFRPRCSDCNVSFEQATGVNAITIPQTGTSLESLKEHLSLTPPAQIFNSGKLRKNYTFKEGYYYYGDALYIPDWENLRTLILTEHHEGAIGGHQGAARTIAKLVVSFYWETMREDATIFCQSCDTCQRNNHPNRSPSGLLHPLPIPEGPFMDLAMDFADMPLSSDGYDAALVIICRLTRMICVIPTKKTATAKDIATLFFSKYYCLGRPLPLTIVSDRDKIFVSLFWTELMKAAGITLHPSTARHQESDGITERAIRTIKLVLKADVDYTGGNWCDLLPTLQFALNSSVSAATGYTPFELMYPFTIGQTIELPAKLAWSHKIEMAQRNVAKAQDKMVQQANKNRRFIEPFKEGAQVLLHRDGVHFPADSQRQKKLLPIYLGPFTIVDSSDSNSGNYTLKLPVNLKIHPVFHHKVLKPYTDPKVAVPDRPANTPVIVLSQAEHVLDFEKEYEVEAILDHQIRHGKTRLLLKWKGYGNEGNTWEPLENITKGRMLEEYVQSRGNVTI